MKNKINLAIIGLGYWGPNFVRLCNELNDCNLVYCCDLNISALNNIQKQFPLSKTINDYKIILNDPLIDGVIVVTPPATHYKICRDVLLSNKDVLVEKPLTVTSKEALKLHQLSVKTQRFVMVDHIYTYNNALRLLKNYIDIGKLGKIYYISGSYTALGPVRSDVNAVLDLAPHHFYIFNYLLHKKPEWISAVGQSYLKEGNSDVAMLTIGYPDGILATVHVSWLYPFKVRDLVVVADKKMASFDDISPVEKLKIFDKGASFDESLPEYPAILKVVYRDGDIVTPHIPPCEPLKEVLIEFMSCIRKRKKPLSDSEDGLVVVKMLEAAQKSLKVAGKRVKIL